MALFFLLSLICIYKTKLN